MSPGHTEKNNNMRKFTEVQFIAILFYAHISVEYLCKISHTSLRIVRNMQNSLETCGDFLYAQSLGCLCSNPYFHEETK